MDYMPWVAMGYMPSIELAVHLGRSLKRLISHLPKPLTVTEEFLIYAIQLL